MAVDAASLPSRAPQRGLAARVRAVPSPAVLAAMIGASIASRVLAALPHATPRTFPDEYIYAALARSLGHGRLEIRGSAPHFPALLEPLLAAPLTLVGSVETTFRLTQAMHAVAMSLVAIPVFLLARRLGLPRWQQLGCAAVALALPEFVYTSYITADALALPLAAAAIYAGVIALERPTCKSQGAFVSFAALATLDRVQYVVLPAAFIVAALVVRRARITQAVRAYGFTITLLAAPVVGALALGPRRALGYYHGVLDLGVPAGSILHWIAVDAMMLVFACGVIAVPAALFGLVMGVVRPLTPSEGAFAAFVTALAPLLLVEVGLYAASGTERFQGRYLESLLPLAPLLFFLGMRRLETRAERTVVGCLAFGIVLVAARVPLSGYVVGDNKQDSPLLQAVSLLQQHVGISDAALFVSVAASFLAVTAGLIAWRPRVGAAVGLILAFAALGVTSATAVSYDAQTSRRALRTYFPQDRRWVDHAGIGRVAVLVTPSALRGAVSGTLFWNTSATQLLQMRGAQDVDAFGSTPVRVRRDGALLVDGAPYRGPLLVEEYANSAALDGATLVTRTLTTSLWRPAGTPRLVSFVNGRYFDGWFGWKGTVTLWPGSTGHRTGALCMTLHMPVGANAVIDLTAPGVHRSVPMPSGASRKLSFPIDTAAPWHLQLAARRPIFLADGRLVSVQSSVPRFVDRKASSTTCR